MLKVTLHASKPRAIGAENLLGRLDIGYATLDAVAEYKVLMLTAGIGEQAPARVKAYPRWSASIWDLVVRAACVSMNRQEAVWPPEIPVLRKGAFINNMTAVVEHWPDGLDTRRSVAGIAHVEMSGTRCNYRATFTDDMTDSRRSEVFRHTPIALTPWDLLTRAFAWTTTETFKLPVRPTLYTPIPIEYEGKSYVSLETVREPARTGCYRWLAKRLVEPVTLPFVDGPCVTEQQFVEFLRKAV